MMLGYQRNPDTLHHIDEHGVKRVRYLSEVLGKLTWKKGK